MDKYISIKQVLDDVLDHPLLKDLSFERAVDYTVKFIRIVGCPKIFEEKCQVIRIEDYRGELPCDYHNIIQVRKLGANRYNVLRYSTDSFHMSELGNYSSDLTYKVQGNVIFTSFKEGDIEIAYRSFATDDEGYPLIPDNVFFIRALELFIKKQAFTIYFDLGKITPQVYNNVMQEYAWAVGQAQTSLIMPSVDEMQSITNSLNTLVARTTEHDRGFVNTGSRERIKLH